MSLPAAVFRSRQKQVKEMLGDAGHVALIVTRPDYFYLLTGFHLDVRPWERPVAAVFPGDAKPFLVMNELSTNHLRMAEESKTLHVKDWVYYLEHVPSRGRTYTRQDWAGLLVESLEAVAIIQGTVAVDEPIEDLKRRLPQLEQVTVSPFLIDMREVKHPEELAVMRLAGEFSDWGQDLYIKKVAPGKLCNAVDSEVAAEMYQEAALRFPDRRIELRIGSLSGPASAAPHGPVVNTRLTFEKGHGVVNVVIVRLDGLVVENERTFFLGPPNDLQKSAYEAATKATIAATSQMVAGNTVAEIDAAAQEVIEKAGFGENILHRTGHGLGVEGHDYPYDVAFNYRQLKENEVWSSEPGIYIYGVGGFRQDNTVIVGASEPEVITHRSLDLKDQTLKF